MELIDLLVMLLLACASGCGIGGGGMLVVYLTLLRGVPQRAAQSMNLLFFLASAGASEAVQLIRGSFPAGKYVLLTVGAAIPGVLLGSALRGSVSGGTLRTVFGLFLLAAGLTAFRHSGDKSVPPAKALPDDGNNSAN